MKRHTDSPPAKLTTIRRAKSSDAKRIAQLSGELGYPATRAQVSRRLGKVTPSAEHAVFVADAAPHGVIGWVHVSITPLLETELRAEVNALIVSEKHRSHGAGALLLQAAETWARTKRCQHMSVRSNVIRERARIFYARNGYEHYKTQKAFRKELQHSR